MDVAVLIIIGLLMRLCVSIFYWKTLKDFSTPWRFGWSFVAFFLGLVIGAIVLGIIVVVRDNFLNKTDQESEKL